jgi:pimeloyl-ACP methyl ester carboxylesterase
MPQRTAVCSIILCIYLALRLRKEIPGSELKLIKEGGHFVQEDAPEETAKALAGFFSGGGERA